MKTREEITIASRASPILDRLRKQLPAATVELVGMSEREDGTDLNVQAKFMVTVSPDSYDFHVHVMKNGVFRSGSVPQVLALSKLKSIANIAEQIGEIASQYSSIADRVQKKSSQNVVIAHIERSLSVELEAARASIRDAVREALVSEKCMSDATRCWEAHVREQFHQAMSALHYVSPDLMHRLVDEFFVREVQDE